MVTFCPVKPPRPSPLIGSCSRSAASCTGIFGPFLSGALRNPSASDAQFGRAFIGAALAEGLGIFAFLVAILLLFVK